jgi:hypothetical protein
MIKVYDPNNTQSMASLDSIEEGRPYLKSAIKESPGNNRRNKRGATTNKNSSIDQSSFNMDMNIITMAANDSLFSTTEKKTQPQSPTKKPKMSMEELIA